jgi:hypothetical protein
MLFKGLWRGTRVELYSPLSRDECVRRLKSVIDPWWKIFGSGEAIGGVSKTHFRARQRIWYRNSFQTVLHAKLEDSGSGTRVVCTYAAAIFVRCFTAIWLVGVILIGGPIFCNSLFAVLGFGHDSSNGNQQDMALGLVIPVALPAFVFAIMAFGRWLARNERSFLNQLICDTLQAHTVVSPVS